MYNFSHTNYILSLDRKINDIVDDLDIIINEQILWYNKSFQANFWGDLSNEKSSYQVFIWNMSYIVMITIDKLLANFSDKDILENEDFKRVINKFFVAIKLKPKKDFDLKYIRNICNNVFVWIYYDDNSNFWNDDELAPKNVITDFISNKNGINEYQIESIHHLTIFLNDLTIDELIYIWTYLINSWKFNNYNFEFFKLKTIDIIINKLVQWDIKENIVDFLDSIIDYIEENKIASQLLNTYSRLYLSIADFYSFDFTDLSNEKALKYYTIFSKINWTSFDFEKMWKDIERFKYNIWLFEINSCLCDCQNKNINCAKNNISCIYKDPQIIRYWSIKIKSFERNYDSNLKNELDWKLSDILEELLNYNWVIMIEDINKKISCILSKMIFHWVANAIIIDECNNNDIYEKSKTLLWLESQEILLFNWYKLLLTYPKIYKDTFIRVFLWTKDYIVKNIKNIITSYLKRRDWYIDNQTWLANELKLKTILNSLESNISFVVIKLNTIKSINNRFGYENWDYYMVEIAKSINNIDDLKWKVYRLSGAQFWLILPVWTNISSIVERIKKIKINILWNDFKLEALFGIVENDNKKIVEKSFTAISHAKKKWDTVWTYTESINDSLENKEDLEYLQKLDKAIEEDRIIPFFQAIFDNEKNIYKYEVLMRIDKWNWNFSRPDKYLKSARKFWRLNEIAKIVISKIFHRASKDDIRYSINLSWEDLNSKEVLEFIKEKLNFYKIEPRRITFEILEWEWNELSNTIDIITELKDIWFRIAMDDFWADNSNINRLLDLLRKNILDELKIDWQIIKSLVDKDKQFANISRKMLEWIIDSAHIAWVKIIAEYIENMEIEFMCKFLWVDYLQWYHLWKPWLLD